jgi:hypothetical protein
MCLLVCWWAMFTGLSQGYNSRAVTVKIEDSGEGRGDIAHDGLESDLHRDEYMNLS